MGTAKLESHNWKKDNLKIKMSLKNKFKKSDLHFKRSLKGVLQTEENNPR